VGVTHIPKGVLCSPRNGRGSFSASSASASSWEPRLAGAASGVAGTTRQIGGVLGTAVSGAILFARLGQEAFAAGYVTAMQAALLVAAAALVVAALLCVVLRGR
jgi:hypothetical protein